jgi:uncharacterized membrane protein
MSARARFLVATASGLVLAALVHLATVLAIPALSRTDALSRTRGTVNADQAVLVRALQPDPAKGDGAATQPTWLPAADPDVAVAVCAYNLDDGPVRVTARTGALFQSLSVHARNGSFYAITDQAAVRGTLDLVVMTRRQFDEVLASSDEDEVSRDLRVVAPARQGYVVVRVLAGLPSQRAQADEAARSVACTLDAPPDNG